MIKSFKDEETAKLFRRQFSRKLPQDIQRSARRKLELLDGADTLQDLRQPPANHLEKLSGDREGQYSMRINDQWRMCFAWRESDVSNVESVEYHEDRTMTEQRLPPIHPGEILLEEFLKPMNISQYRLAKDMSVPARRINEIVQGKRAISADTALRLSRYFGLSERFWMNLQGRYDLEAEKDRLAGRLEREVRAYAAG